MRSNTKVREKAHSGGRFVLLPQHVALAFHFHPGRHVARYEIRKTQIATPKTRQKTMIEIQDAPTQEYCTVAPAHHPRPPSAPRASYGTVRLRNSTITIQKRGVQQFSDYETHRRGRIVLLPKCVAPAPHLHRASCGTTPG